MAVDMKSTRMDPSGDPLPAPGGVRSNFPTADPFTVRNLASDRSSRSSSAYESVGSRSSFLGHRGILASSETPWDQYGNPLLRELNPGFLENSRSRLLDRPFLPSASPSRLPGLEERTRNPSRPRLVKVKRRTASSKGKDSRVNDEKIEPAFGDSCELNAASVVPVVNGNGEFYDNPQDRGESFRADEVGVGNGSGFDELHGIASEDGSEVACHGDTHVQVKSDESNDVKLPDDLAFRDVTVHGVSGEPKLGASSNDKTGNRFAFGRRDVENVGGRVSYQTPFSSQLGLDPRGSLPGFVFQSGSRKESLTNPNETCFRDAEHGVHFTASGEIPRSETAGSTSRLSSSVEDGMHREDKKVFTVVEPNASVPDFAFMADKGDRVARKESFLFGGEKDGEDDPLKSSNIKTIGTLPEAMRKMKIEPEAHFSGYDRNQIGPKNQGDRQGVINNRNALETSVVNVSGEGAGPFSRVSSNFAKTTFSSKVGGSSFQTPLAVTFDSQANAGGAPFASTDSNNTNFIFGMSNTKKFNQIEEKINRFGESSTPCFCSQVGSLKNQRDRCGCPSEEVGQTTFGFQAGERGHADNVLEQDMFVFGSGSIKTSVAYNPSLNLESGFQEEIYEPNFHANKSKDNSHIANVQSNCNFEKNVSSTVRRYTEGRSFSSVPVSSASVSGLLDTGHAAFSVSSSPRTGRDYISSENHGSGLHTMPSPVQKVSLSSQWMGPSNVVSGLQSVSESFKLAGVEEKDPVPTVQLKEGSTHSPKGSCGLSFNYKECPLSASIQSDLPGVFGAAKEAHADIKSSKTGSPSIFSENPGKPFEFNAKLGRAKMVMPRKKREKSRQPSESRDQPSVLNERSSQDKAELNCDGICSPMDVSPYRDWSPCAEDSMEAPVASSESLNLDAHFMVSEMHPASTDEIDVNGSETKERLCGHNHQIQANEKPTCLYSSMEHGNHHLDRSNASFRSSFTCVNDTLNDENVPSSGPEAEVIHSSLMTSDAKSWDCTDMGGGSKPESILLKNDDGANFHFSLNAENSNQAKFEFSASPSTHSQFSSINSHQSRKHRTKAGKCFTSTANSHSASAVNLFPLSSIGHGQVPRNEKAAPSVAPQTWEPYYGLPLNQNCVYDVKLSVTEEPFPPSHEAVGESLSKVSSMSSSIPNVDPLPVPTPAAIAASLETCEKWRLRGNQAYGKGELSVAEECYTRGIESIPSNETSKSFMRELMLCLSNRAATRFSLGRVREALLDCMEAIPIDSSFHRVQLRAASCYLALGDVEAALEYYNKCLQDGNDPNIDQKVVTEASNGLKKAKKLIEYIDHSSKLLQQRTVVASATALEIINEGLTISPFADHLVQMKADALLMLCKYEEVIQLCEQTRVSAERNSVLTHFSNICNHEETGKSQTSDARVWRLSMISRSYFLLGRFEDALDMLEKHGVEESAIQKYSVKTGESVSTLSTIMCEMLRLKSAGNEAFQARKHAEAIEHYTSCLAYNVESRRFSAICFCNRAAAYQALNQLTDAIADCSLAIALDATYPKALSRRATLHEMIRDYDQAFNDLQRLVSVLERQIEDKQDITGGLGKSGSTMNDLRQARQRLATVQEELKKDIPLDIYLILGVDPSCTASEIKKAYRKAALKHHPDKAGQLFVRSDILWREIFDVVYKDADKLFKMIGEAYAVASDPTKRIKFDVEEETRKTQKNNGANSSSWPPPDSHSSHTYSRGGARGSGQDMKTHSSTYYPRPDSSRTSRF